MLAQVQVLVMQGSQVPWEMAGGGQARERQRGHVPAGTSRRGVHPPMRSMRKSSGGVRRGTGK